MLKKDRRRHFYLINKPLQYGFLALVLVYCYLFVVFLALALFVPDIVQMGDHGLSLEVRAAAADRFLAKRLWVWPAVITLVVIIAFHSFRSFWRVVGPLYRFQVVFKQVRSGDLSYPLTIRTKDYLHPEAETLNDMLRVLAEKLGGIQQTGADALKSLTELENHATGGLNWNDTHQALLDAHRRHLEGLVETARYFQVQRAEPAAAEEPEDDRADSN